MVFYLFQEGVVTNFIFFLSIIKIRKALWILFDNFEINSKALCFAWILLLFFLCFLISLTMMRIILHRSAGSGLFPFTIALRNSLGIWFRGTWNDSGQVTSAVEERLGGLMVSKVTVEEGGDMVGGTSADWFCSPANRKKKIHQHVSFM